MKHSLKLKLIIIMAALVTSVVAIICVLNTTVFEKYYFNNKFKELKKSYNELREVFTVSGNTREDVENEIRQINSLHNINVFVLNSAWEIEYSSQSNSHSDIRWFMDVLFGGKKYEIMEETDEYIIVKDYNESREFNYMEIYGVLDDGSQIIMQITLESIQENVELFNKFVIFAGVIILLISIIVVYITASRFVKPVNQLSAIAQQMSNMNFDVKYTGTDKGELGVLGHSINIMSQNLESQISELKRVNLELRKDIENRNKNEEMRSEFLSNVSHELKTPIALIQGYAEGLREGIADDRQSMDFYCDVIIDESTKMNNMVRKLLTLNQIEFGNEPLNIERFDLNELLDSVIKNNTVRFRQNQITLQYNPSGPLYVFSDKSSLEEVITNFLSNAINHCDYDKIIEIQVEKEQNDKVKVSIYNTGNNIPEEDIDRIWEKFYKVDKARTREYGGNGIGLSIVKAIMDNLGADYGVLNMEKGVKFWFKL